MKFSFIPSINLNHKKIDSKDFYAFLIKKIQRERERVRAVVQVVMEFLNGVNFWFFVVDGGMFQVWGLRFEVLVAGCSFKHSK